ncbi:MAG: hypothetical protein HY291_02180 [Planctomycetes bacterium]|nr:hypothetical protein [Planctomycetota bacterium]
MNPVAAPRTKDGAAFLARFRLVCLCCGVEFYALGQPRHCSPACDRRSRQRPAMLQGPDASAPARFRSTA